MVRPGLSRRQMVAAMGLAGVAAGVPALRRMALPSVFGRHDFAGPAMQDHLTLARFAPYVGSRFTLEAPEVGRVMVTLEEATASGPKPADRPGLKGEAFSLVFEGTREPRVGDGTRTLVHPALGSFPLFLVAVGRDDDRQAYQAIVDRRVPPAR